MSYYQEPFKKDPYADCRCFNSPVKPPCKDTPCASGLIDEIMKKYFCQKAGQGSSCSLFSDRKGSVYSVDRRLLYWTKILEERKKLACRIKKVTGKRISHVLYNQLEEYRNVQNVKRIIDYAQRLDPTKLSARTIHHIQDPDVFETLPRSERQRMANLAIVGTPKVSQAEQCIRCCEISNNSFLTSSFLRRTIKTNKNSSDMANILEFFPDIDHLQVVGQRIHKHERPVAERISDYELSLISSESNLNPSCDASDFPECSILINDTVLRNDMKLKKFLDFQLKFKCRPYERQTQSLFRLKNIGRKPVVLVWRRITLPGAAFVYPAASAFTFNRNAFRLTYSETEDIEVLFMSTGRLIREEKWYLRTEPSFFEEPYCIRLKLLGECYIPDDYFNSVVFDLMDTLLCTVVPGGESCGRRRVVFSEKEIFENNNPGFKCEPGDLLRFKEIYRQVKRKNHAPVWDMNLQTLKQVIEGLDDYTQRSRYMNIFMKIIREMRRRIPDCDYSIKVLLIRSLIVSIIDQWEVKAARIVHSVENTDVDVLVIKMPFEHVIEQLKKCKNDEEKRKIIQYNALYIKMYCSLGDLAEDIVSFMENCLLLYAF